MAGETRENLRQQLADSEAEKQELNRRYQELLERNFMLTQQLELHQIAFSDQDELVACMSRRISADYIRRGQMAQRIDQQRAHIENRNEVIANLQGGQNANIQR